MAVREGVTMRNKIIRGGFDFSRVKLGGVNNEMS